VKKSIGTDERKRQLRSILLKLFLMTHFFLKNRKERLWQPCLGMLPQAKV
jgi:hypothetical protein